MVKKIVVPSMYEAVTQMIDYYCRKGHCRIDDCLYCELRMFKEYYRDNYQDVMKNVSHEVIDDNQPSVLDQSINKIFGCDIKNAIETLETMECERCKDKRCDKCDVDKLLDKYYDLLGEKEDEEDN